MTIPPDIIALLGGMVLVAVALIAAFAAGKDAGRMEMEEEAVDEGVAEYYIDEDYEKAFRFKDRELDATDG